jgi:hypothetical protein
MTEMAKLLDMASAAEAVNQLGIDDLRFLNKLIVDRIHFLRRVKSSVQMTNFTLGERVGFWHNRGRISGIIVKFNKQTVTVTTDEGMRWKVSPDLLEREGKSSGPAAPAGNFLLDASGGQARPEGAAG